jgi:glycosyltransferase involved in cell wall biosynthesis
LRVRILSQLRALSGIDAVESITFLSLSETKVPNERLRALERQVPKVHAEAPVVRTARVRGSPRVFARFLRLRLLHNEPYIIAVNDCREMHALVTRHLRNRSYDVAYLGFIGMMAYIRDIRSIAPQAAVVLEQHNVEWQIFQRLAASLPPPLRYAALWEARALRRYERRSLRQVDSVIAISDADAAELRNLARIDSVVVPPFIEPGAPRVETVTQPHLGYIGHLGWQPNAYGLDWFCRDVWPRIRERVPNATLTIAGPGLRKGADGVLAVPSGWQKPGITTVGFVDDLEDLYRATLGMVAPVVGGSGVRMKLLESMRAGMPTVTTADGAAGLQVADGREVLIADDANAFAECVVRVVSEPGLRAQLRAGGYAFLASRHSESIARASLERALADAKRRTKPHPLRNVLSESPRAR